MTKKLKYIFIILSLLFCFIFISITSYARSVSDNLSDNFFRLHILANSDSKQDQDLKLKIRDAIIEYMSAQDFSNSTKSEVMSVVENSLDSYKAIAQTVIANEGLNYNVSAEVGNFHFPTKVYGNISLPAGYYDALRIKIGNAEGQNWWCSLFPPLCFVDISSGVIDEDSKNNLKENLSDEEFAIVTSSDEKLKLKFKLLEFFSN